MTAASKVHVCDENGLAAAAIDLELRGYTVIQPVRRVNVGEQGELGDLGKLRAMFDRELAAFPEFEFKPGAATPDNVVLGGFSALGNPSSFHNETVRQLRAMVHPHVRALAAKMVPRGCGWNFEQVVDRMLIRPGGRVPSAEAWHRDVAPGTQQGDQVWGGWLNLDDRSQWFSCVPGTHRTGTTHSAAQHQGFAPIPKEERKAYKARSRRVEIPAGCVLVFSEDLVHEVVGKRCGHTMYRLFLGWRLTRSTEPLVPDVESRLEDQAVMPLKSAQMPRLFAKLHWTNWRKKLEVFGRCLKSQCQVRVRVKTGKDAGAVYTLPHPAQGKSQHMKSLRAYGLPMYRKYDNAERALYRPQSLC